MNTHFSETAASSTPRGGRSSGPSDHAIFGDRALLVTLALSSVAALAIASYYGGMLLAVLVSGGLLATSFGAYAMARGTLLSRLVICLSAAASVALHIDLGRGTLEFHFGVFALLALVMVYRDWRPIVAVAGFFAVHHVAFDRLQAMGWGVYCTPEPNFLKIVMHAGYVVVQTSLEVYLALMLARLARQGDELVDLIHAVDAQGKLDLSVAQTAVHTEGGKAFTNMLGSIGQVVALVRDSSQSISSASTEIARGGDSLSRRTEEAASNLQQTAASMEELSAVVRASATSAQQANAMASTAASAATRGSQVVSQVVSTMGEISDSSRRIGDIIGVIDGIAFQTNLLALNAAVEAARAGDQGRGFAVVAGEVRALAQRSAEAAREIKGLIGNSVDRVESGSSLVNDAGKVMNEILASVQQVSEIISHTSTATNEQSTGLGQINDAVNQLDRMTQENAALVEESSAAAESLRRQAQELAEAVSVFEVAH